MFDIFKFNIYGAKGDITLHPIMFCEESGHCNDVNGKAYNVVYAFEELRNGMYMFRPVF